MKVIIDTNVVMSAIFFGGIPHKILSAWRNGLFTLVISNEILEEYTEITDELLKKYHLCIRIHSKFFLIFS